MTAIDTRRVRELIAQGAQLVEVLPESDYRREHIPGAINIPLPRLDRSAADSLDRGRPVIVYCYDLQCDLSSRGAALLTAWGFDEAYDYAGSKAEWLAMGIPSEGSRQAIDRVGARIRPAVTCPPDRGVGELPEPGPGQVVVVVDADDVVVGAIQGARRAGTSMASITAIDVMDPGPATVRPGMTVDELAASMRRSGETHVIVTTLDGRLLGVVTREDIHVDR